MDKPKLTLSKEGGGFYRALEIDVLARTLWGEARGQGQAGLEAVACVVLNRVEIARERGKYWWGGDIIQVCQKPYQFSCWNRSDPSYQQLVAVDAKNRAFVLCQRIARAAVNGDLSDGTGGATHYHANYVSPYWAQGERPTAVIGAHIFYCLI
ncbi:MAG: cell wall hydrolase [Alphaproteobacteria bacterium]